MFDYQATGDEDIAVASKVAYEETKAVINASSGGNVFCNTVVYSSSCVYKNVFDAE